MKLLTLFFVFILSTASEGAYYDSYCKKIYTVELKETWLSEKIDKLKSNDVNVFPSAALSLSCYPDNTKQYIPEMIERFDVQHGEARLEIISIVAHYKEHAVPYLVESLKSKNIDVRRGACMALRTIGPKAKAALPALKELLSEPGYDVSMKAKRAIESIQGGI